MNRTKGNSKEVMKDYINTEIRQGANICYVHVSSRNRPRAKFDRYPVPDDSSNIYLNSCAKDWYLNGLPCWGNDFDASLLQLQELIASTGAKKIVCIGSSMGAFGAALFASRLHADLICFAPELYLNVYSGFSKSDKLGGDLPRLENKQSPRRALIIAGVNSPSDVVCAKYFQGKWPDSKSYFLNNCGHATGKHLKDHGLLDKVIENFTQGIDVSKLMEPLLSPHELLADYNFVEPSLFSNTQLDQYNETVYDGLKLYDTLQICAHLRSRGASASALKLVEKAQKDYGPIAEIILLKAQCFRSMRKHQDAIDTFLVLQSNPQYKRQALLGMSMVYTKLGRMQELHDLYAVIVADAKNDIDLYLPLLKMPYIPEPSLVSSEEILLNRSSSKVEQIVVSDNCLNSQKDLITEISYVNSINASLKAMEIGNAAVLADTGLKNFPNSTLIQSLYALISQKQKDWPATVERLLKLLGMEDIKHSAETYARLVQAYRNGKQVDQAESIALEGFKAFPDNLLIQSEYAWTAQVKKDWGASIARLEKLLLSQGNQAGEKTYVRLAQAYWGLGKIKETQLILAQGLIKFPNSIRIKNECAANSASEAISVS